MAAIHLERATLTYAHLEGSVLTHAHLYGTAFNEAHLEGVDAYEAHFEAEIPANLHGAYFDESTKLYRVTLANDNGVGPRLFNVRWGDTNISAINWDSIRMTYDEFRAHQPKGEDGQQKGTYERVLEFEEAMRTNRQLSAVLQEQGLSEDAAKFAYRAQNLQRKVWALQRKVPQYAFSLFVYLLAGYGYRLGRSFVAYLIVILGFATVYFIVGPLARVELSYLDALTFSMTSFHGRGFSPGEDIGLSNPVTVVAALEAFVGLIIEVTLIATVAQRFFGK